MRYRPEVIGIRSLIAVLALLSLAAFVIAAPILGAIPDTLALNDEDAQTCKSTPCRTITEGAYRFISIRVQQLEEENERLREKLAKKPNPKFCT